MTTPGSDPDPDRSIDSWDPWGDAPVTPGVPGDDDAGTQDHDPFADLDEDQSAAADRPRRGKSAPGGGGAGAQGGPARSGGSGSGSRRAGSSKRPAGGGNSSFKRPEGGSNSSFKRPEGGGNSSFKRPEGGSNSSFKRPEGGGNSSFGRSGKGSFGQGSLGGSSGGRSSRSRRSSERGSRQRDADDLTPDGTSTVPDSGAESTESAPAGSGRRDTGPRGRAGSFDRPPTRRRGPDGELEPPPEMADPEAVARDLCLRALTGTARTRQQLAEMLAGRDVPDEAAAAVLDRFTEVGLIDDAAFAAAWVASRQTGRGLSKRALASELRAKGVDPEVAAVALEAVDPQDEWDTARRLVEKKIPYMRRLDTVTATRRLTGMLARKGYNGGLAGIVVREALGADADTDPDDDRWVAPT